MSDGWEKMNNEIKAEGVRQSVRAGRGMIVSVAAMFAVPLIADAFGFFENVGPGQMNGLILFTMFPGTLGFIASIVAGHHGERKARLGIDYMR